MLNNYSQINLVLFEVFSCSENNCTSNVFAVYFFSFFISSFFLSFLSEERVQADVWAVFNFMPLLLSGPCRMGHATRLQRDAAPLLCYCPPWHLSRLFRHHVYLMVKIRLSPECLCKGTINIDWEFQPVTAIRGPGPCTGVLLSGPFCRKGAGAGVGSAPSWVSLGAIKPFRRLWGHLCMAACCCPCVSPRVP